MSSLWARVRSKAEEALASGHLRHIASEPHFVDDDGVRFVVRRATNLARKEAAASAKPPGGDPFMAPEPELLIGDLSPTHYALLNKYNVIDRHLLVVTRAFVDQEAPLDLADFEALSKCMVDERERLLGFYNAGRRAGASQPHKHLQVVTLPLAPHAALPIEAALDRLPFPHALDRLRPGDLASPRALLDRYHALLGAIGAGPYNLLVTRDWMLAVPRNEERYEQIPINSLAFAGSLFVRDEAQLATVERVKPMAVLKGVTRTQP